MRVFLTPPVALPCHPCGQPDPRLVGLPPSACVSGVVAVASANSTATAYVLSNLTQGTSYAAYLVAQDTAVPPNNQARAVSRLFV